MRESVGPLAGAKRSAAAALQGYLGTKFPLGCVCDPRSDITSSRGWEMGKGGRDRLTAHGNMIQGDLGSARSASQRGTRRPQQAREGTCTLT